MKDGRKLVLSLPLLLFAVSLTMPAYAEDASTRVLITNVNVWDGTSDTSKKGMDVLVEDNLIKKIGKGLKAGDGATVIKGGGRTLMPGMIEAHAHLSLHGNLFQMRNDFNWMYIGAKSGAEAGRDVNARIHDGA